MLARSSDAGPAARARAARTLSDLDAEREAARAAVEKEGVERGAVERLEDIRMARYEIFNVTVLDRAYAEAYREAGIDVDGEQDTATVAALLLKFEPERRDLLIGLLYDWQTTRRLLEQPDARLVALLEAVDTDPWMARVRAAVTLEDLRTLAQDADVEGGRVVPLMALCNRLAAGVEGRRDPESALALAQRLLAHHPEEFYLNTGAALWAMACDPPHLDAALRAASVVVALRPHSAYLQFEIEDWTERANRGGRDVLRAMRDELRVWLLDPDLASFRDAAALARLPRDEQRACRSLLRDAERLLERTLEAK